MQLRRTQVALVAPALILAGCTCSEQSAPAPAAKASAPARVPPTYPSVRPPRPEERAAPPSGPRFAILTGQGIGPIRIGATVATIERLMEAKCEVVTPTRCLYVDRGVEFELTDGVTSAIVVHRGSTDAGGDKVWGWFNGVIPPDVQLGMTPEAVQEHAGKPTSVKRIDEPGSLVKERHEYAGMTLEYDHPSRLALLTVRITKPKP